MKRIINCSLEPIPSILDSHHERPCAFSQKPSLWRTQHCYGKRFAPFDAAGLILLPLANLYLQIPFTRSFRMIYLFNEAYSPGNDLKNEKTPDHISAG